jgi:hypothetical protein
MVGPASLRRDVVNSQFSPVNYLLARRFLVGVFVHVFFVSIFIFIAGNPIFAQPPPQSLEEGIERLARKAAALPHERRMSLIWTNHATLSEQRSENLRGMFAARLESGAQIRWVQGEAAPGLRVFLEQTPSQIVITASVPAEGNSSVVMEQVARTLAAGEEKLAVPVRIEKELMWQQETKILSAALPASSVGTAKKMVVLTEEALLVYRGELGVWKLLATKVLPGPKQAPRVARGQLLLVEDNLEQIGILLPGRRCEGNLADESPIVCAGGSAEWRSGRLLALPACGTQTWWLKSDGTDWASEDRLQLRASGAASNAVPVAELNVPGPVFSIGAGVDGASAAVVVRNISTGNYEVYRVALSCAN